MERFKPDFSVGSVVTNQQLTDVFKVGNMGGMRRSHTTNTLVIISDHTKGLYDDKWYGEELHYTGMGKVGNQVLAGNQNKTLAESDNNGVDVHLFEVFEAAKYVYQGVVKLSGEPYKERQKDDNGNMREVWMFPLRVEDSSVVISDIAIETLKKVHKKKARLLSEDELKTKAMERSSTRTASRYVISNRTIRDEYVSEYSKVRAQGICQLCDMPAPFSDKDGKPYLESHHIVWLSKGGSDSIDNTVALCPNCHKKVHIINNPEDIAKLQAKVKE